MNFAMEQTTFPEGTRPTAKLWGEVRLDVRPDSKLPKGGYAAIKSKVLRFLSAASILTLFLESDLNIWNHNGQRRASRLPSTEGPTWRRP